jgi:hypothetical protein
MNGISCALAGMPAAWIETGKAYVICHLMEVYGNTALLEGMPKEFKFRMQSRPV